MAAAEQALGLWQRLDDSLREGDVLRWLSRLAWIVRNPGRMARLLEAESAAEIHATLLDAAGNLPGSLKPTGKPTQR